MAATNVRLQGSANHFHRGPYECVKALYAFGGLRTVYRSFTLQLCRDIPASGTYFIVYEYLHKLLMNNNFGDRHGVMSIFTAGGFAGILSWTIIVPLDVIKSMRQADYNNQMYKSSWDAVQTVYRNSGVKGFYSGYLMICLRSFPTNAITFLVYKKSLDYLNYLSDS